MGTNSNHPLYLYTNGNSKVAIDATGNVGIGLTNPTQGKLHIEGTNANIAALEDGGDNFLKIGDSASIFGMLQWSSADDYLRIYAQDGLANADLVLNTGTFPANVGITTATPDRRLDIFDDSNPQLRLTQTDGTVYADFQVNSDGDLVMNVDGVSNQLILDNGGNVGIGNVSPTKTLDVTGTARINANSSDVSLTVQQALPGGGDPLKVYGATDSVSYGPQSSNIYGTNFGHSVRVNDNTFVYYYYNSTSNYARVCVTAGDSLTCGTQMSVGTGTANKAYASVSMMGDSKVVFAYNYYSGVHYSYAKVCDVDTANLTLTNCGGASTRTASHYYVSVTGLDSTKFLLTRYYSNGVATVGTIDGSNNISWGSDYTFNSGVTYYMDSLTLSSTKAVIAYAEATSYGQAIVANISGTTVSFGSEITFYSGSLEYLTATSLSSSAFAIAYEDSSNFGMAGVGTVSGSTITMGGQYGFASSGMYPDIVALTSDKIVIGYYSGPAYSITGAVSGTTISFEASVLVNEVTSQMPSVVNLTSSKFVISYLYSSTRYARVGKLSSSDSYYTTQYGGETNLSVQASTFEMERISDSAAIHYANIYSYPSYYHYARVCLAFGDSVSCGSNVNVLSLSSASANLFSVSMMGDSKAVFSGWYNNTFYTRVCDIVGSSITNCGGYGTFSSGSYGAAAGLSSNSFVAVYTNYSSPYYGTARIGTIDGSNNISWGSDYTFNAVATTYMDVEALSSTKFVIAYSEGTTSGQTIIGDVSGTTISFGSEVTFNSTRVNGTSIGVLDSSSFALAYIDYTPSIQSAKVGTVSGNTITLGGKYAYAPNTSQTPSIGVLDSETIVISSYYSSGGAYTWVVSGKVSGTSINFGNAAAATSVVGSSPKVVGLNSTELFVSYYYDSYTRIKKGNLVELSSLSPLLIVNSSGNIGLGTHTPSEDFVISDGSTELFKIRTTSGTTGWNAANAMLYVGQDSGTSRSINAAGSINASGADYAEYFATKDENLAPGELLTIDKITEKYVKRTDSSYDGDIVGAVSLKPAFVGNDIEWSSTTNSVLVALMGQVKVRVSLENGPIEIGDKITSSSIPGTAMKATRASWVLGTALTALSTSTSEVMGTSTIDVVENSTSTDTVIGTSTDALIEGTSTDIATEGDSTTTDIIVDSLIGQSTSTATSTDGYPEQYDYVTVLINPHWWAGYISGSGLLVEEFSATSTATSTDEDSSSFLQVVWNSIKSVPQLVVNGILEAKNDIVSHGVFKNIVKVSKNLVLGRTIVIDNAATAENSELEIAGEDENSFSFVTYSITSPRREIMVSGSGKLIAISTSTPDVEARIAFHPSFSSLISTSTSIRVIVTPTSYINGNLYVAEKSIYGFTVKEVNSQDPGVEFDWIVTARLTDADLAEEVLAETESIVTQENLEDSTSTDPVESVCTNGENRPCGADTCDFETGECLGVCEIGVQVCEGGQWGECMGAVMPSEEICDGVDNNCNGEIDDGACGAPAQESVEEPSETDISTSTDETADTSTQASDESTTTDSIIEDSASTDTIIDSTSTDPIAEESTSTESVIETDSQEDSEETSSSTDATVEELTSTEPIIEPSTEISTSTATITEE
jgi:hypothetical protein